MRDLRLSISVPLRLAAILVMGFALAAQPAGAQQPSGNSAGGALKSLVKASSTPCQFAIKQFSGFRIFYGTPVNWRLDVTNTSDVEVTVTGEVALTQLPGGVTACATQEISPAVIGPHSTQRFTGALPDCAQLAVGLRVILRDTGLTCQVQEQTVIPCRSINC